MNAHFPELWEGKWDNVNQTPHMACTGKSASFSFPSTSFILPISWDASPEPSACWEASMEAPFGR